MNPTSMRPCCRASCVGSVKHGLHGDTLDFSERSLVSGLRETRNKWAHQEPSSTDDARRGLDSVARSLTVISAPQAAAKQAELFENI